MVFISEAAKIGIIIPILKRNYFFPCSMARKDKNRRNEKAIMTLAFNIRKYRKANKLTITQLSNILDLDYSQLGRMERGKVNSNISIIFDIADTLKIEPAQLLEPISPHKL